MTRAEEIPPSEAVGDDIFFNADITCSRLFLVTGDEHPRITTAEIVENGIFIKGDGVSNFCDILLLCGYKRSLPKEHVHEMQSDESYDECEEERDEEKPYEEKQGHNLIFFVGVPGIEPGSHAPEACVIPLYNTPYSSEDEKSQ